MASTNSQIGWTDRTRNTLRGCNLKDAGCLNCYAMELAGAARMGNPGKPYAGLTTKTPRGPVWNGKIRFVPEALELPTRWKTPCMIFENSMSDWQHEKVTNKQKSQILSSCLVAPWHVYQFLTKRAELQQAFFENRAALGIEPLPPSLWFGVSVTHHQTKYRIDVLRNTPGITTRWVSFEPLIGQVGELDLAGINWVVIGGESEHRKSRPARPMHTAWAADIIKQARAQRVPIFFKQHGRFVSLIHLHEEVRKRVEVGGRWLTFDGRWTHTPECPKRPIWKGGADLIITNPDQHSNLWYGEKLEQFPGRRHFPPDWPHALASASA